MGSTRDLYQGCTILFEHASKDRGTNMLRSIILRARSSRARTKHARETHERNRMPPHEPPAVLFHDRRNYTVTSTRLKPNVRHLLSLLAVAWVAIGASPPNRLSA